MTEQHMTKEQKEQAEKERMTMQEMMPYFLYAALPVIFTIIIAWKFGPSM